MKLHEYLKVNAHSYPDKIAVTCGESATTYAELYRLASAQAANYCKGQPVVFRATPGLDFFVTYFAIHIAEAVAVPIESNAPEFQFNEIVAQLRGTNIPDDVADILFTTGTTGKSKGVMLSHRAIVATAENLIAGQGYHHDLCFIICGPLNHIGSLSKVFPTIITGGSLLILPGLKDFSTLLDAFDFPCQRMATFIVPSGLRMLMRFGANRIASYADKIEFIETGAAPMAQTDMDQLRSLLPKSRLYNTYASTETGVVATYDYQNNPCIAGCLGRALPHSSIHITNDGHVACSGSTLMTGYVGDEDLTHSVLINGVIYTADKGRLDDDGALHLLGRDGDVINVGGYKVSPIEIENIVLAMDAIADCICIPFSHPELGKVAKLLFVPAKGLAITPKEIATHIATKVERFKVPTLYEQVPSIKRTYNGKLDRKAYL